MSAGILINNLPLVGTYIQKAFDFSGGFVGSITAEINANIQPPKPSTFPVLVYDSQFQSNEIVANNYVITVALITILALCLIGGAAVLV